MRKAVNTDADVRRLMGEGYNCAETLVILGNERYGLGLTEDAFRLLSAFGGGMYVGKTCGAITGALAVVGKLAVADRSHLTEDLGDRVEGLLSAFQEAFGSTDCDDIVPLYRTEEDGCCPTVELAVEVLDAWLKEQGLV